MQRGERVWQVAFGSGFKCNSAVWRALRPVHDTTHAAWKHVQGREDEAMRALLAISEASKVNGEGGQGTSRLRVCLVCQHRGRCRRCVFSD